MTPQEALQMIPAQLLYDDEDDLSEEFCERVKCDACYGFMPGSHVPKPYGCDNLWIWVEK